MAAILLGVAVLAAVLLRPSDQKELEAAYTALDSAMRRHDLPAYMAQLAPDYKEQRTMGGKLKSRNESEANYRNIMQDWTMVHDEKSDIYRLVVRRAQATVIVERSMSATLVDHRGLFGPKGRSHAASIHTMEVDSWAKPSRQWLMKLRSVTSIQMTLDGTKMHSGVVDDHDHDH